jgi:hypothetical protein
VGIAGANRLSGVSPSAASKRLKHFIEDSAGKVGVCPSLDNSLPLKMTLMPPGSDLLSETAPLLVVRESGILFDYGRAVKYG